MDNIETAFYLIQKEYRKLYKKYRKGETLTPQLLLLAAIMHVIQAYATFRGQKTDKKSDIRIRLDEASDLIKDAKKLA